jgi:hypothetical protein
MSGGITQLVAIGAQDAYLTGKPEVSFFQSTYKRHTNFARVTQRQVIQGNVGAASMTSIKVEHKGDLLNYVYITKRDSAGNNLSIGTTEIDHIDLLIGGQVIDSQTDDFIRYIADPLLCSTQNKASFGIGSSTFYPLRFWFCETWSSALPLIALQYHDVEIRIYWASGVSTSSIYEAWGDFTYLDNAERAMFTQTQKVLMYQTQKQSITTGSTNQNLVFNQPVKFLAAKDRILTDLTGTLLLQINGVDIGEQKQYVPHFTSVPNYYTFPWTGALPTQFLLPFCLDVSKIQPTGQLNFSRLDSARLVTNSTFSSTASNTSLYIYAVSYNVLQFEKGMAGLLYAN